LSVSVVTSSRSLFSGMFNNNNISNCDVC
jgi:hypothetical protein